MHQPMPPPSHTNPTDLQRPAMKPTCYNSNTAINKVVVGEEPSRLDTVVLEDGENNSLSRRKCKISEKDTGNNTGNFHNKDANFITSKTTSDIKIMQASGVYTAPLLGTACSKRGNEDSKNSEFVVTILDSSYQ